MYYYSESVNHYGIRRINFEGEIRTIHRFTEEFNVDCLTNCMNVSHPRCCGWDTFVQCVQQFSQSSYISHTHTLPPLCSPGKLRGMLPCLGAGRHSFLSLTLPPPPTPTPSPGTQGTREEEREEGGRQCLFFNDGQGGICCLQLDT